MDNTTPLCKIAYQYGTDKCPQIGHHYTPIYYELFKDKILNIKKVLELGIGSAKTMQAVPDGYQTGASLLMWRDFFPNAQVYGLDRSETAMISSERIETFICDQRNRNNLRQIINKIGTDIDLFIDDGSHRPGDQVRLFHFLMPILKKDVVYIIEDVQRPNKFKNNLGEYNIAPIEFTHEIDNAVYSKKVRADGLVIIRNNS
jgi:trans-aconitate methyltransferase